MSYYSTNFPSQGNYYYCKYCSKCVWRDSNKKWINSFCTETDKTVRLLIRQSGTFTISNKEHIKP